ncbi:hypothetical protein GCM10009867_32670 [Pedococcus aerophilus]|uniref:Immunity protein Imm1 n=1 Tax=Pedococcus aerophilus TaxID=436356 RepID=A0ABN3UVI1_9MICO
MAQGWRVLEDDRLLDGSAASALLQTRVDQGLLTTYLQSDTGCLLTFVSNGARAMIVLMERAGDPGQHAVSPGDAGSSGGYVLDNGQEDTYDDADTVPLADALADVRAIVDTGRPPREMRWAFDR